MRNEAWPNQVSEAAAIGLLSVERRGAERKGTSGVGANLGEMARRVLPALLALAALTADLSGSHGVALAFLLASIPAAFVLALDCYGDAIEARCSGLRPFVAGGGLVLLVLSAALRSPAVVGGVPRFAISAVAVSLFLYLGALLMPGRRRTAAARRPARIESDQDRLAAQRPRRREPPPQNPTP